MACEAVLLNTGVCAWLAASAENHPGAERCLLHCASALYACLALAENILVLNNEVSKDPPPNAK